MICRFEQMSHTFGAEVHCPPVNSSEIKMSTTAASLSTQSSSSLTSFPNKATTDTKVSLPATETIS